MKKLIFIALLSNAFLLGARVLQEMSAAAQAGKVATANGDTNGDGGRDLIDAVYLLNWLFSGGPEPVAIAGSPELEARVDALEEQVSNLAENQPTVEEVAAELAARHADSLRGPQGPPGPPGGTDPLTLAVENLKSRSGTGSEVWNQPIGAFRIPGHETTGQVNLRLNGAPAGTVLGFVIEEKISSPSRIELLEEVADPAFDPSGLTGAPIELTYERNGRAAIFRGEIVQVEATGWVGGRSTVQISAYSSLHRLNRGRKSRSFQGTSVPEIVSRILVESEIGRAVFTFEGPHPLREYTVQYRETDLDFITRILADEGIYYFIDEEADGTTLRFGDGLQGRIPPPSGEVASRYHGHLAPPSTPDEEYITTFGRGAAAFTGNVVVGAYDFITAEPIFGSASAAGGQGEDYDFGVGPFTPADLQAEARIRLQGFAAGRDPVAGTSNIGGLRPGREFHIDAAGTRFSGKYLITGTTHTYVHAREEAGLLRPVYGNSFTCIPAATTFRPPRVTPLPAAGAVETAVVTGLAGEEVSTDAYGRVKVKFHWDRESSAGSGWIRMAQPMAGSSSGTFMLPEVGDEVLVAFLHGDPRHPYVIGSLWNGRNPPPVALPGEGDRKVIRSSRKGGGANEVLFDDTRGEETLQLSSPRRLLLDALTTTVEGRLDSVTNAGPAEPVQPGQRLRDNAIVAWARVTSAGEIQNELGVTSVSLASTGVYYVVIDAAAASPGELIPMAVAEVDLPPVNPDGLRFVSIQKDDPNSFIVFINDGRGQPVSSGFVFLATAR